MNERTRDLSNDPELFIEIAKLWSDETDSEKSFRAYTEAARLYTQELSLDIPPRLLNNLAVLDFTREEFSEARAKFEEAALVGSKGLKAGKELSEEDDAVLTTVGFNLGVVAEALEEIDSAKLAYSQLLTQHPEFVDGQSLFSLSVEPELRADTIGDNSESATRPLSDESERFRSRPRPHQRDSEFTTQEPRN